MFELMQLRCFVAVADELHFGRAADRMNMTQPPLSRQIQILERVLGVELIERTSRSVKLTAPGRAFLPDARRILSMADAAAVTVKRIASGHAGTITIGFTASTGYSLLPRLVEHVREQLPEVDLNLREMVTTEQHDALLGGGIDVGLMRSPAITDELETRHLTSEKMLFAVPTNSRFHAHPPRQPADLNDVPLIMYSPDGARSFYDLLQTMFASAHARPNFVQFITHIHSMLGLVDAGLGVALVPEGARALRFENVSFLDIKDDGGLDAELHLVWRPSNRNAALVKFVDKVMELADRPSASPMHNLN
jgi:DNA-binding transcriptional LysR family regulator